MTKHEFQFQFVRLCKGFKYDATAEQTEAWYQKVRQYDANDWLQATTTLLCGKYFPKLDEAYDELEKESGHRRRTQVYRDNHQAERAMAAVEAGQGCPFSPTLLATVKAVAGREQVRHYLRLYQHGKPELSDAERKRQVAHWGHEDVRLTKELAELLPKLTEAELSAFMDRYGNTVNT